MDVDVEFMRIILQFIKDYGASAVVYCTMLLFMLKAFKAFNSCIKNNTDVMIKLCEKLDD